MNYTFGETAKAWVGLIGTLLTAGVPAALESNDVVPAPWSAIIAAVIALLTALGIFKVPNSKPNSSISYSGGASDSPWPKA